MSRTRVSDRRLSGYYSAIVGCRVMISTAALVLLKCHQRVTPATLPLRIAHRQTPSTSPSTQIFRSLTSPLPALQSPLVKFHGVYSAIASCLELSFPRQPPPFFTTHILFIIYPTIILSLDNVSTPYPSLWPQP